MGYSQSDLLVEVQQYRPNPQIKKNPKSRINVNLHPKELEKREQIKPQAKKKIK